MKRVFLLIKAGLIGGGYISSAWWYERLPAMMPMHWNIRGEVDRYSDKSLAVWFVPTLALLMWGMFALLPRLDPRRKNYKKFEAEFECLQVVMIGFMTYVHLVLLTAAGNTQLDVGSLVIMGMGIMFGAMGWLMRGIKQNFFVGIRTPWALMDEKNWNKTHELGGKCFMLAGGAMMVGGLMGVNLELLVGAIILMSLVPVVYSYLLFRKK